MNKFGMFIRNRNSRSLIVSGTLLGSASKVAVQLQTQPLAVNPPLFDDYRGGLVTIRRSHVQEDHAARPKFDCFTPPRSCQRRQIGANDEAPQARWASRRVLPWATRRSMYALASGRK